MAEQTLAQRVFEKPVLVKRNGLEPKKLSDAQVEAIRFGYPRLGNTEIGRLFGITRQMVYYIRAGKRRLLKASPFNRGSGTEFVRYQPVTPELLERYDLDAWFARRAAALLNGYTKAVLLHGEKGVFEAPDPKGMEVEDGLSYPRERYTAEGKRGGRRTDEDVIASLVARARRRGSSIALAFPGGAAGTRPSDKAGPAAARQKAHGPDAGGGAGRVSPPGLLYDHKS